MHEWVSESNIVSSSTVNGATNIGREEMVMVMVYIQRQIQMTLGAKRLDSAATIAGKAELQLR